MHSTIRSGPRGLAELGLTAYDIVYPNCTSLLGLGLTIAGLPVLALVLGMALLNVPGAPGGGAGAG